MKDPVSPRRQFAWAIVFMLLLVSGTAFARKNRADAEPASAAVVVPVAGARYVGSEQCKICHADQARMMQMTPHYRIFGPDKQTGAEGCEYCHGPGSAHIDGGGDRSKISRLGETKSGEVLGVCMNCHVERANQTHFNRSMHARSGVTCVDCHRVHTSKEQHLLAEKETNLCYRCHLEKKGEFSMPFHHRVNEGLVSCSDCHNVHGGSSHQVRSTADQSQRCFKCHADKRGPFVFEHYPVKSEGCTTCHTPHGSNNPRLLTRARVNTMCLECHQNFYTAPHPQNTKSQACTWCHVGIHGSNTSPFLFK